MTNSTNESLKNAEEITLKGFIPYLEQRVMTGEISQEEADYKACVFLGRCHDKSHVKAMSSIGERWLSLAPQELIEGKVQEIKEIRQSIAAMQPRDRSHAENRAVYLEREVEILSKLLSE